MPCIRCGNDTVKCEGGGSPGFYRWLCIGTLGCKANYQMSRYHYHPEHPEHVRPCFRPSHLIPKDDPCFSASLELIVKDVVMGKAKCDLVKWTPNTHKKYFKQQTQVVVTLLYMQSKLPKTWGGLPIEILGYILQLTFDEPMANVRYKCHRCGGFNTHFMGKDKLFATSAWWWCRHCNQYCYGRNFKD